MALRKYPSGYAKCLMTQKRDEEAKGKRTIDSFIGWSTFQQNDPIQQDLESHHSAETESAAASHHTPDLAVNSDPEICESSHDESIAGYLGDDQEHLELEENYEAFEGVKMSLTLEFYLSLIPFLAVMSTKLSNVAHLDIHYHFQKIMMLLNFLDMF
uniref:Uncharacterized protein n=1 Tax=Amphimedon queenslandica TaxID=400682 RepID=A0A1X7UKZ3_AMPQE